MTTSSTDLDTLIAELDALAKTLTPHYPENGRNLSEAAQALTALRIERDALAAVIDWVKDYMAVEPLRHQHMPSLSVILATASTTALADRDARILEEAAEYSEGRIGRFGESDFASNWMAVDLAKWLRARAVSRRREASPQEESE